MIITLDEDEILSKLQFDDDSINLISENTIILASTITNEKILKKLNNKNLFPSPDHLIAKILSKVDC